VWRTAFYSRHTRVTPATQVSTHTGMAPHQYEFIFVCCESFVCGVNRITHAAQILTPHKCSRHTSMRSGSFLCGVNRMMYAAQICTPHKYWRHTGVRCESFVCGVNRMMRATQVLTHHKYWRHTSVRCGSFLCSVHRMTHAAQVLTPHKYSRHTRTTLGTQIWIHACVPWGILMLREYVCGVYTCGAWVEWLTPSGMTQWGSRITQWVEWLSGAWVEWLSGITHTAHLGFMNTCVA